MQGHYNRLLKPIEVVNVSDPLSKALVGIAEKTLDMCSVSGLYA